MFAWWPVLCVSVLLCALCSCHLVVFGSIIEFSLKKRETLTKRHLTPHTLGVTMLITRMCTHACMHAGMTDVVLVESGTIGCGTTWHAAGLIGQMRATQTETLLSGVYGCKVSKMEIEARGGGGGCM